MYSLHVRSMFLPVEKVTQRGDFFDRLRTRERVRSLLIKMLDIKSKKMYNINRTGENVTAVEECVVTLAAKRSPEKR